MAKVENVKPYRDDSGRKSEQVEEMFDSIAPAYDFMNRMMTFGLCRHWRDKALKIAHSKLHGRKPAGILDVATGTGDVAIALAEKYKESEVRGIDLSDGMLSIARRKLDSADESVRKRVRFEQGDSLKLPYADNEFDMLTVAYGVRNFEKLDRGLAEMNRVLRPGGILCIVELSEPESKFTRALYRVYSRTLIPALGRMVSGDLRAYSYLPESIAACPQRAAMTSLMETAGFSDTEWRSLTFGAVTIYTGFAG